MGIVPVLEFKKDLDTLLGGKAHILLHLSSIRFRMAPKFSDNLFYLCHANFAL